jgi:UrcA family protein
MGVSHSFIAGESVMTRLASKLLLLSGLAGLAAAGTAGAADTTDTSAYSDVPALVVRYNADMLATDSGARALYRRLTEAAEQVCPSASNTRLISERTVTCREQAVASAVSKIHNQRLAAVYAASSKSG